MHPAIGVVAAYAIGSLPFAYLAGKAHGVDLRRHGSGNLGATNAVRVLGAKVGGVVYALDTLKGFVPAFFFPRWIGLDQQGPWAIAFAVAAVLGHMRPIFLGFSRGGKGIATAGGAFLGLAPLPMAVGLVAFALVFLSTGYASAASLAATAVVPIGIAVWQRSVTSPLFLSAVALASLLFYVHRANIGRLRRGEEHRFNVLRRRAAPTR